MKHVGKKKIGAVIIAAAIAVIAAVVFLLPKESAFRKAARLQEEGSIREAYEGFRKLGSWRDSAARAEALEREYPQLPYLSAEKWDLVTLGSYEQDGVLENGPEPLEWFVIYRESDGDAEKLELISRYCLECMAYNNEIKAVTWDQSSMRDFLNGRFYQESFSDEEKRMILPVTNENPGNDVLGIDGGPDTEDRVFLLNSLEMSVCFPDDQTKWTYGRAEPTQKAADEGIYVSEDTGDSGEKTEAGYTLWWLRGPGNEDYSAQFVEEDGNVFEGGAEVDIDYIYGMRPALWISVESVQSQ